MKGVVLAAGRGTRLLPVTKVIDKTVLPVYDKPIIFYALDCLYRSGIKDVLIVHNSFNGKMISGLVGDGRQFGLRVSYKKKDHTLGMPFSILQAERFCEKEPLMVIPGDNLFLGSFEKEVKSFKKGAVCFLRKVKDLTRFGVADFRDNSVVNIIEKPKVPPSQWAVIAPYIFDSSVFGFISELKPSSRGELEVVELLKKYLELGTFKSVKRFDYWADIGTFEALTEASWKIKRLVTSLAKHT